MLKSNLFADIISLGDLNKDVYNAICKAINGSRIVDLLLYIPKKYEILTQLEENELSNNKDVLIKLKIIAVNIPANKGHYTKKKRQVVIECVTMDGRFLQLIFFQIANPLLQKLKVGNFITCRGIIKHNKGEMQITHPKVSINGINNDEHNAYLIETVMQYEMEKVKSNDKIVKITPVYSNIQGLYQYQIRNLINKAFNFITAKDEIVNEVNSFLQTALNTSHNVDLIQMLKDVHQPSHREIEKYYKAVSQLSFVEILTTQLAIRIARKDFKDKEGISIDTSKTQFKKHIKEILPFTLTEDQQNALDEINTDQQSSTQMVRLLHGDVGSGKTIVALLASAVTVENGYQVIVLSPTAILAAQHYENVQKLCFGLGLNIRLLTGNTTAKEKAVILSELKTKQVNILIGTHALLSDNVKPIKAGLFIIDEQHNFGVQQRISLINKCQNADILMMSATPIPRTVAMALYGDIKVSTIKTKPANRLPIKTSVLNIDKIDKLAQDLLKRISSDKDKVYWICPLVEESEKLNYTNVTSRYEYFQNIYQNKDIAIGLLHGKMKEGEKQNTMLAFKASQTQMLISTTVIEVGVDVPDATIIVIENAEKFGLAQLHQLRGRVGRGGGQSYCILLYGSTISQGGRQRLEVLKNNYDGFLIADYDLKMRGSGTILGNEQSGFSVFRFATLGQSGKLVPQCIEIAKNLIKNQNAQRAIEGLISIFIKQNGTEMLTT